MKNNRMKSVYLSALLFITMGVATAVTLPNNPPDGVSIISPKVEMQENPVGLGTTTPRFSWQLRSNLQDVEQETYQIQVARTPEDLKKGTNLVWDSGIVPNDVSVLIPYEGEPLVSRAVYYWRARVATNQGETAWSHTSNWSMALLDDADWRAKWIGEDTMSNPGETAQGNTRLAARYLRKSFESPKQVQRAVLYISGLGAYEAYLNGERVSNDVLAPTVSWFPERVYYNVYDVTPLIWKNDNLLAVKVGNGRYFGMRESPTEVFGLPRLLAQLEIEYTDGTTQTIISDESWRVTSNGPIIANNEFDGEEYDARKELPAWNLIEGGAEGPWKTVDIMTAPEGVLTPQPNPNITVMEEVAPVSMNELPDGKFILDMGQNMVGWITLTNVQGKEGQPITLRFAEILKPDGTLYMDNLRGARVTDIYTPAKDGPFSWEPSFVFHGFRYVEISGMDTPPALSSFTGKVIHDKMETTGQFTTSNPTINQLVKNAYWGIRGNYRGMPTDCPQRDERHGWLGDRTTGAFGESFLFDNALLYSKWLQDIEDSQSPEGSISVVSPRYWTLYNDDVTWPAAFFYGAKMLWQNYGDTRPIHTHYAAMKRYMERIQEVSMEDFILTKDTYGDWCMPPESQELIHSHDPSRRTAGPVLSTTVYYSLLELMGEFATVTGNEQDIEGYNKLAAQIKEAYNDRFFDQETARYDNNTVTANVLSLRLGLVPQGREAEVFNNIVQKTEVDFDGHVSTGVLGIQHLMRGLTEHGNVDLAYRIATNTTYPSWGYMIEKGATTIWELWNGDTADPAMNSGNHVMLLGDVLIWLYEDLAGIKNHPESTAYKKLWMEPKFPEGLTHVNASYQSPYGAIKSEWKRDGEAFSWSISIPSNTLAIVRLPIEIAVHAPRTEGVRQVSETKNYREFEIGSGDYHFTTHP